MARLYRGGPMRLALCLCKVLLWLRKDTQGAGHSVDDVNPYYERVLSGIRYVFVLYNLC